MNKESYRAFLNVPDTLPPNFRVKLEQDLILVPLFNTDAMLTFKDFLSRIVVSSLIDNNIHPEKFNSIVLLASERYVASVNPLIEIGLNNKHELHSTLIALLYRFHDQKSIDTFLNDWWAHKKNFVSVLSTYEGWSYKNFALKVSGSTSNGIDYEVGTQLFSNFLRRYRYWRQYGLYKIDRPHSLLERLRFAIGEAFRIIVLDNIKIPNTRGSINTLPYHTLSGDMMSYKSYLYITEHLKQHPVVNVVDGKPIDLFAQTLGFKFNDIPSLFFFESILLRNDFFNENFMSSYFSNSNVSNDTLDDLLLSSLFVLLRANKQQLSKQVAVKKLTRLIVELNVCEDNNLTNIRYKSITEIDALNFTSIVDAHFIDPNYRINTDIRFKVRNPSNNGFSFSDNPSYQQAFQKLIECFSCKSLEQTFVINLHPVAQLFSSHFTNSASCHNMVDLRRTQDGPDVSMLGQHHKGQFQMAAAGGFIVAQYDSFPDDHLCFKANDYRAQLFINPELDCIRQHLAYPGRNNDELAKAEAKTYRNIIHELLTPWHGHGTEGWLASKSNEHISTSGFNWQPSILNKRGDTLQETKDSHYFGYNHESTFAFSHVIYPEPHHFKLPIAKNTYPMTSSREFITSVSIPFYTAERSKLIAFPKLYTTVNGLSSSWDQPYTHNKWSVVDKPLVARSNNNLFIISPDTPHSSCKKCNILTLNSSSELCDKCLFKSNSNLFSSMVSHNENPIYFNYKSQDDLANFLSKASTKVSWKNNDSLISFIPNGPKFLLVLKDGKLSIKVTNPKDTDTIIDVSSVVFE